MIAGQPELAGPAFDTPDQAAAWYGVLEGKALASIVAERIDQVTKHGFTLERDQRYEPHELPQGANAYVEAAIDMLEVGYPPDRARNRTELSWPATLSRDLFRPTDARAALVKAAAMLWAAIDRLDHAQSDYSPAAE